MASRTALSLLVLAVLSTVGSHVSAEDLGTMEVGGRFGVSSSFQSTVGYGGHLNVFLDGLLVGAELAVHPNKDNSNNFMTATFDVGFAGDVKGLVPRGAVGLGFVATNGDTMAGAFNLMGGLGYKLGPLHLGAEFRYRRIGRNHDAVRGGAISNPNIVGAYGVVSLIF